jgi:DegV family protein with EDD domain
MSMKIVTDSASDMTAEEAQSLGISLIPLYIQFPEGEVSSADLTPDEFYNRLKAMVPQIPTTSQPAPGTFTDLYNRLGAEDSEILSLHVSSGLSGTIQAARQGASQTSGRKVTVVDCLTLSGGQRFQVLAAHAAARSGRPVESILTLLDQVRAATETIFTLETLEYLARGGRIGRVAAVAGTLLRLKPIIAVEKSDGKYSSTGRGRTIQQTTGTIVDQLVQRYGTEQRMWVTIMHGQMAERAETFAEELRKRLNVARLETLRVSPVLGVHTGPGVIGAAVVALDAFDGLM